jgi:hypothetical protein
VHRDYDAALAEALAEVFGHCHGDWPDSVAPSSPFLAIAFRFLEAEREDDDEVEVFLQAVTEAHQHVGPYGFPPVDFATRLVAALPTWWAEPSARSGSRYAAWEAVAAVRRITDRDSRGDFIGVITAARTAFDLIQERRRRVNVDAFTERVRALRAGAVPAAS